MIPSVIMLDVMPAHIIIRYGAASRGWHWQHNTAAAATTTTKQ